MAIVVYHNPECGTSRNVVDTIRASGVEPIIIEYLKTGWTRPQLLGLFAAADITPRGALRTSKSPAEKLGLIDPKVDDESLLDGGGWRSRSMTFAQNTAKDRDGRIDKIIES